jgi:iron complex outermembrane receptor protein
VSVIPVGRGGEVLSDLLRGTTVEPVVAGDDQIVLAPTRRTASRSDGDVTASRTSVLERVVVMGTSSAIEDRASPVSMDVVSGQHLARQETSSLSHLIDGSVAGVWMWQQSPTTLFARYGSVRGASSFGLSYPKIYIDGIEVANPLLVRQVDPSTIERLEVIRGPQGSALYGADANSGVINIITRHDGAGPVASGWSSRAPPAMSGSQFATQGVMTQQHALAFRTAPPSARRTRSECGHVRGVRARAFARSFAANGDMRVVGARSVLTGMARLLSERAGSPANPLLPRTVGPAGRWHVSTGRSLGRRQARVLPHGRRWRADIPDDVAVRRSISERYERHAVGSAVYGRRDAGLHT